MKNFEPLALEVREAAAAANSSRSAIYAAIKRGDLVARKNGRRTIVLRADLEKFLANLPSLTPSAAESRPPA